MFDLHSDILTSNLTAKQIERYLERVKRQENYVVLAIFTHDVVKKAYNHGFRYAIEDCSMMNEENILSYSPLYCSLTWNYDNLLAGGAKGKGEVTQMGRKMIGLINENGIVLDLAHLNRKSFFQAAEVADQVRVVVEQGGIVGLTLVGDFMSAEVATIDDFVEQIDYYCSKFGHDSLAIGTDFFGSDNIVKGIRRYSDFKKVEARLKAMGYTQSVIFDIFENNAKSFFEIL